MQFGPMRQAPALSIISTSCFSSLCPSLPASLNPADIIMKAFVFLSVTRISTARKQVAAGIARIARSVIGISFRSL